MIEAPISDVDHTIKFRERVQNEFFDLIGSEDLAHEEECLRNPFVLRCWLRYITHKQDSSLSSRYFLYERALKNLPGSYKLWKSYLDLRVSKFLKIPPLEKGQKSYTYTEPCERLKKLKDPEWKVVNDCFERALATCHRYPVIWLSYCRFLMYQYKYTQLRRTFDHSLRALPSPQHGRIWSFYLYWTENFVGGETFLRAWKRYLKLEDESESFVEACLRMKPPMYLEAAQALMDIVQTSGFVSKHNKTLHDHWSHLCDLIVDHSEDLDEQLEAEDEETKTTAYLDVEKILRFGIHKYPEQAGILWNALAKWWLLKGEFDKVRDIYEEAISKSMTIKDFSIVFDAYAEFEESLLSLQVQKMEQAEQDEGEEDDLDIKFRIAQFEKLIDRRPFLVNDVLLRQNPHNVDEWTKRVNLYKERNDDKSIVETFSRATDTIHSKKVSGELSLLWTLYAKFYEEKGQLDESRQVFEKAVKVSFKKVDELAEIWCQYAEFELRQENYDGALQLMGRATAPPPSSSALKVKNTMMIRYDDDTLTPQQRLFKSLKLWSFYVDLEESIGTMDSTRLVYDRILELKIANSQILINYANFLEDHEFFEDSYKVYERGIELFGFPAALDFWTLYLTKFVKRYQGTKIERARDLFEQSLDKCPVKFAKPIYLLYAQLEEEHGLAKHAMKIYDRATRNIDVQDLYDFYLIYISKATSFFGLTATREIYERALEQLPDKHAREMSINFVEMEIKLGEIDRARAILGYASQFSDPSKDSPFWKFWHDFEVKHGNEDTFKEMLRVKRSVQAKLNADINNITAQILSKQQPSTTSTTDEETGNVKPMSALETNVLTSRVTGFIRAEKTEKKPTVNAGETANQEENLNQNPDAIEMDSDSDASDDKENANMEDKRESNSQSEADDEEQEDVDVVERVEVPEAVFGSLRESSKRKR